MEVEKYVETYLWTVGTLRMQRGAAGSFLNSGECLKTDTVTKITVVLDRHAIRFAF